MFDSNLIDVLNDTVSERVKQHKEKNTFLLEKDCGVWKNLSDEEKTNKKNNFIISFARFFSSQAAAKIP